MKLWWVMAVLTIILTITLIVMVNNSINTAVRINKTASNSIWGD